MLQKYKNIESQVNKIINLIYIVDKSKSKYLQNKIYRSKSKSEESKTSHCELRKLECQKSSVDITKNTDPEYLEFDQHWKQSSKC